MVENTYTHLVPTPNRRHMNSGLSAARVSTLKALFGDFPNLPENCGTNRNAKVSAMLETRNVGPFRCTGIKPALDSLERIFAAVKHDHPQLYKLVGTAGMHCYRRVRGGSTPSNHSAGTAIDLTVGGVLPPMDSTPETPALIPNGFVILYAYFHREGWYWGAGYAGGRVDAMHFEVADETLKKWAAQGWSLQPAMPRLFLNGVQVKPAYMVYDNQKKANVWYSNESALAPIVGQVAYYPGVVCGVADKLKEWGWVVQKYTSKLSTQGTAYIRAGRKV